MNADFPIHLINTKRMIDIAFPGGLTEAQYLGVLKALYPHMSDRNLSQVMAACSNYSEAKISNDIAKVAGMRETEIPGLPSVLRNLKRSGLDNWMAEDN